MYTDLYLNGIFTHLGMSKTHSAAWHQIWCLSAKNGLELSF